MFSSLASLIVAVLFGTVILVGIGIAVQVTQQREARKRREQESQASAATHHTDGESGQVSTR